MAITNEYPEKYAWWINELNSLGVRTETKNGVSRDLQRLENLVDDVKQTLIHEYKINYGKEQYMC
jgi:hypothetical protein